MLHTDSMQQSGGTFIFTRSKTPAHIGYQLLAAALLQMCAAMHIASHPAPQSAAQPSRQDADHAAGPRVTPHHPAHAPWLLDTLRSPTCPPASFAAAVSQLWPRLQRSMQVPRTSADYHLQLIVPCWWHLKLAIMRIMSRGARLESAGDVQKPLLLLQIVLYYAYNDQALRRDFAKAMNKLSLLGQDQASLVCPS